MFELVILAFMCSPLGCESDVRMVEPYKDYETCDYERKQLGTQDMIRNTGIRLVFLCREARAD